MRWHSAHLLALTIVASVAPLSAHASIITDDPNPTYSMILYDGTLETLPTDQHWYYGESSEGLGGSQMSGFNAVLDTCGTGRGTAGWGYVDGLFTPLPLHADTGFTLSFDLQLVSHHGDSSRSGLDLVVVTSDPTKAVVLTFESNKIIALNNDVPDFSQGTASSTIDTSIAHHYVLSFTGNLFTLFDDTTPILTDTLRDFTADPTTMGEVAIYSTPNSIFLGDDTTSACAEFNLSRAEYISSAYATGTVPEPASLGLLALSGLGLLIRRR